LLCALADIIELLSLLGRRRQPRQLLNPVYTNTSQEKFRKLTHAILR
jgi:hypothetical protein